jgi:hypothetical protein
MDNVVYLRIAVPVSMRAEVKAAARAADLTLAGWMRRAVREKLERDAS